MKKRLSAFLIGIVLFASFSGTISACDEKQTNRYVTQILFGDSALDRESDEEVQMLMSALYLCSEQSGEQGQEKIDFLKRKKVTGIPSLKKLTIKEDSLPECSHNTWEHVSGVYEKNQTNRKKVLNNTVDKVFDFESSKIFDIGIIKKIFGAKAGKCSSFAALLYYSHILADYLADDPSETEANVNGKITPAYSGDPYTEINGNRPVFSREQKSSTAESVEYSSLDSLGRAGTVCACIGPDTIAAAGKKRNIEGIEPSGWNSNRYEGIIDSQPPNVYNRCHLLAHSLGGKDDEINLVTGTQYMNETGMKYFETLVHDYIKRTENHVLYRATPIYEGDDKLVSGVQIESYSIEDSGSGISFNVFCYNVQPGVDINYANGDNEAADLTAGAEGILPFAVYNANDSNPDLIFEMNRHLEILFADQISSATYSSMMGEINALANEARDVDNGEENAAKRYILLKACQYDYLDILKSYIPQLLGKEEFFTSVFQ